MACHIDMNSPETLQLIHFLSPVGCLDEEPIFIASLLDIKVEHSGFGQYTFSAVGIDASLMC